MLKFANHIIRSIKPSLAALFLLCAAPAFAQQQETAPQPPQPPQLDPAQEQPGSTFETDWAGFTDAPDRVHIGGNLIVKTNETLGQLVVIGGSAEIYGRVREVVIVGGNLTLHGEVERDAVVVVGGATINGRIKRELFLIMGKGDFSEKAVLGRNSVLLGGPFNIDPGATLDPRVNQINMAPLVSFFEWLKNWIMRGLLYGRIYVPDLPWTWVIAAIWSGFYLLLSLFFPRAIRNTVTALETRPLSSLIVGMLCGILYIPLIVLLATLVVPIPAIPFVKLAFFLLMVFGKAAVLCFIGKTLLRGFGYDTMKLPAIPLLLGAALLTLAYIVPVLGLLTFLLATCVGVGAAFVALVNSLSAAQTQVPSTPVAVNIASGQVVPSGTNAPYVAPTASEPQASALSLSTPPVQPDVLLLQRVGFWKRLLAAILDLALLSLTIPFLGGFVFFAAIVYFVAMWTWKGTTIGMIVLGLKLVRLDGKPLNFAVALVRSLSSFFSGLVLFLGFLWAGWDRDKQSWHDKIAGTVIVRMPKGVALI